MELGRSTLPTPPVCRLLVSVHGPELSISIVISRLLVHRCDNVPACTVHCIQPARSLASAGAPGPHEGAEAEVPPSPSTWWGEGSRGARRPPGYLKRCKDCPSAAFEGFDPSLRSIRALSICCPSLRPIMTVQPPGGEEYLHAAKIQDDKRTRVEILL